MEGARPARSKIDYCAAELRMKSRPPQLAFAACLFLAGATALTLADEPPRPMAVAPHEDKTDKLPADLSGHKRVGKASIYDKRFVGRKMADGASMQTESDNAASRTLPIGTTAKVTNIETGASAVIKIEDRGPYVKGRIVDLRVWRRTIPRIIETTARGEQPDPGGSHSTMAAGQSSGAITNGTIGPGRS
jgi:rare lipoprotein A